MQATLRPLHAQRAASRTEFWKNDPVKRDLTEVLDDLPVGTVVLDSERSLWFRISESKWLCNGAWDYSWPSAVLADYAPLSKVELKDDLGR